MIGAPLPTNECRGPVDSGPRFYFTPSAGQRFLRRVSERRLMKPSACFDAGNRVPSDWGESIFNSSIGELLNVLHAPVGSTLNSRVARRITEVPPGSAPSIST